jgi:hemin uptake protein HemP
MKPFTQDALPPGTDGHNPAEKPADSIPTLDASQLFQGRRELWIEHEGERYRLRLTRRNKLILQK